MALVHYCGARTCLPSDDAATANRHSHVDVVGWLLQGLRGLYESLYGTGDRSSQIIAHAEALETIGAATEYVASLERHVIELQGILRSRPENALIQRLEQRISSLMVENDEMLAQLAAAEKLELASNAAADGFQGEVQDLQAQVAMLHEKNHFISSLPCVECAQKCFCGKFVGSCVNRFVVC